LYFSEAASETTESSVEATTVLVSIVPEETLTTTQEPEGSYLSWALGPVSCHTNKMVKLYFK
jgi:hypothetical protein